MKTLVQNIEKVMNTKAFRDSWKVLYNDEQAKFRLKTIFKILSVSFLTLIIQAIIFFIILRLDMLFFKSYEVAGIAEFESVFYNKVFSTFYDYTIEIFFFIIFVTLIAMYVSKLIMRPFLVIGNYCENYINDPKTASYDPDFFTDLKLLTRFSEYFFLQIENAFNNKIFLAGAIPNKYKGIYKPKFELSFFLQFSLIIILISSVSTIGLYFFSLNIYDNIVALATDILVLNDKSQKFLIEQEALFKLVTILLMFVNFALYFLLSFHLYSKVSAPAFAIFATMRSFLKGNKKARVHLIGNYQVRPNTIKLNRYLDYVEKNLIDKSEDGN